MTLTLRNLTIALPVGGDRAQAVSEVSFDVRKGEILCLVGESGSGKSVIAQAIMGLLPKTLPLTGGEIVRKEPVSSNTLAVKPPAALIATNPSPAATTNSAAVAAARDAVLTPAGRTFGWEDVTNDIYTNYIARVPLAG